MHKSQCQVNIGELQYQFNINKNITHLDVHTNITINICTQVSPHTLIPPIFFERYFIPCLCSKENCCSLHNFSHTSHHGNTIGMFTVQAMLSESCFPNSTACRCILILQASKSTQKCTHFQSMFFS